MQENKFRGKVRLRMMIYLDTRKSENKVSETAWFTGTETRVFKMCIKS